MSAVLPTIVQSAVFTALRSFFLTLVDCEVIRGLSNGTPMPVGDFIVLTPSVEMPLSQPYSTYDYDNATRALHTPMQVSIQVDCYGDGAHDRATVLRGVLFTDVAVDAMAPVAAPLYAEQPRQLNFVSGEENYMERWSFDAVLQYNPVIPIPQDFAETVVVGVINVDAAYPPGA